MINKDLGMVTAYAYAVSKGYAGTEDEFATLMASYADVGQTAIDAALRAKGSEDAAKASETAAASSASSAINSATTAATKASEAAQSVTNAGTSATNAANSATAASGSASTASTKASQASQSATDAANSATAAGTAKTDAETAKTAAQTAQTAAETAQGKAEDAQAAAEAAAQTLVIDTTLTQPNQAAEAKATGDAIGLVKSQLEDIPVNGVAASAKQLLTDKGVTDAVPYLFRKTGGDGADREYDTLVGGTVAWNQLIKDGNFTNASNWYINGSFSKAVADNVLTLTTTGAGTASNSITPASASQNPVQIPEHKYFVSVEVKETVNNRVRFSYNGAATPIPLISITANTWAKYQVITRALTNAGFLIYFNFDNTLQSEDTVQLKNWIVIDLTQMFGTAVADYIYGLETAHAGDGVAFFRSLFPADYYAYDAGTLKSVGGVSAHRMVGYNQWDEEWELGVWTGEGIKSNSTNCIRSKNYIHVLPNTEYNFYISSVYSNGLVVRQLDRNKAFLATTQISYTPLTMRKFTTLSNCEYVVFCSYASNNITVYNNDICLNLSSSRNGIYKPYEKHTYALDDSLTLRGIPKLTNGKLYYDGDTYAADGTVTRKYGVVDLGTLTWAWSSAYSAHYTVLTGVKRPGTNGDISLMMSVKYAATNYTTISGDYTAMNVVSGRPSDDRVYVRTDGTEATTPTGYLVYLLATPTTETAEPFQSPQICSPYGTEEYIATGIVPVGHSTFYPENLRAKIEELPSNFSTLIAPTESTFTATQNYTTGALFIIQNVLYKATANIANGGTIMPGTNCTATTLAEIISALS